VVAHLKQCRDVLVPLLQALPGVEVPCRPRAACTRFSSSGFDDSLALAKRLVAEAGLGLAPGNAFAPEAQGWLRWCFASKDPQRLGRAWTGSPLAGWSGRRGLPRPPAGDAQAPGRERLGSPPRKRGSAAPSAIILEALHPQAHVGQFQQPTQVKPPTQGTP
jgi:hypothetical protein